MKCWMKNSFEKPPSIQRFAPAKAPSPWVISASIVARSSAPQVSGSNSARSVAERVSHSFSIPRGVSLSKSSGRPSRKQR